MLVGREEDVRDRASGHMHPITMAEAVGLAPELAAGNFEAAGLDTTSVSCNTDILMELAPGPDRSRRRPHPHRTDGWIPRPAPPKASGWALTAGGETCSAGTVVNAAGAWADPVAGLFGARPRGLQPYRRTAAIVEAGNPPAADGPMVAGALDNFYYRPDLEGVLISPSEAVPSPAGGRPAPARGRG